MSIRVFIPGAGISSCIGSSNCVVPSQRANRPHFRAAVKARCRGRHAVVFCSSGVENVEAQDKTDVEKLATPDEDSSSNVSGNSEEQNGAANESEEAATFRTKTADWTKAERIKKKGAIFEGVVVACNEGGVLIQFYTLRGFLPYSQLNQARIPKDGSKTVFQIGQEMVGQIVPVQVREVNRRERRLVFSETKALWAQYGKYLKPGALFDAKVHTVVDYGAFVNLRFPDGTFALTGLVHNTELSWDRVTNPKDVLTVGDLVKVKVISSDIVEMKLALSIKQTKPDPLLETLDSLMPAGGGKLIEDDEMSEATCLPGIEQICQELGKEKGVSEVSLGRLATEKHVVSQDLELWLSHVPAGDGQYTVLARAGRQVQEVNVSCELGREEMKSAIQRVTTRLP